MHGLEPVGCHHVAGQKIDMGEAQGVPTGGADIICDDMHLANIAGGQLGQEGKSIDAHLWLAGGGQSALQVLRDLPFDSVLRPTIRAVERGGKQSRQQQGHADEGQSRAGAASACRENSVKPKNVSRCPQSARVANSHGSRTLAITPGMKETRSRESCRIHVSVSPFRAEEHLLVSDQPPKPHTVHPDAID